MTKKFYKNEKFQNWFFSILYFLLIVSVVITGCFIFKKKFYQPIVVDGRSMLPTLAGGDYSYEKELPDGSKVYPNLRCHYGLADLHYSSVNNIHRFDVIVTYYPDSWGTDEVDPATHQTIKTYKIKRVWGFPGETLNLTYDAESLTYTFTASKEGRIRYQITSSPVHSFTQTFEGVYYDSGDYKKEHPIFDYEAKVTKDVATFSLPDKEFNVVHHVRTLNNKKLGNNEYFVMGDNWGGSTDCYEKSGVEPLTKPYLQGRVICINAYVTLKGKETVDMHKIPERYLF